METVILSKFIAIPLTRKNLSFCTREFSVVNPQYAVERNAKKRAELKKVYKGYNVDFASQTIRIQKGLQEKVFEYLHRNNIEFEIRDMTVKPKADLNFHFPNPAFKLKDYQETARSIFAKKKQGVISFDCGLGKTITALSIAGDYKFKTIVLVHTGALLKQWIGQIAQHLHGDYTVGTIGEGTYRLGDVTVALFQSFKTIPDSEIYSKFGMVIVDECHHIPAETFFDVITKFRANVVLGLSATLKRKDKMEFLIEQSIGSCLYQKHREDTGMKQTLFVRRITDLPTETRTLDKKTKKMITKKFNSTRYMPGAKRKVPNWVDAIGAICYLKSRTNIIIEDVTRSLQNGRKCLVLSDRVDHCKEIYTLLQPYCKVKLAIGGDSDNLDHYKEHPEDLDVLIGTKIADEGLDIPSLDTLFLSCPLSLKDIAGDQNATILDQRIGRIGRTYEGKEDMEVYLYQDMFIDYFNSTCNDITAYLNSKKYKVINLN
jgi:superfamily II DNA or RNA helicase